MEMPEARENTHYLPYSHLKVAVTVRLPSVVYNLCVTPDPLVTLIKA